MALALQQKIRHPHQGVYLFGTTPPKFGLDDARVEGIAHKLLSRLQGLQTDGLIIYDIQDESRRVSTPRPFPFKQTIAPTDYSQLLQRLSGLDVITYKSVTQRSAGAFKQWLDNSQQSAQLDNIVLVGSPSSDGEIKLSLADACQVTRTDHSKVFLGGVTIAERHSKKRNEHRRLLEKTKQGCQYFISQAVYDTQATIDLLTSYALLCRQQNIKAKRVILTFTPCGGEKTLTFMQWLGISVPQAAQSRILSADSPLDESIDICHQNLKHILNSCAHLDVPLGLNIESLTNRKSEIEASVNLYQLLKTTMENHLTLLRTTEAQNEIDTVDEVLAA